MKLANETLRETFPSQSILLLSLSWFSALSRKNLIVWSGWDLWNVSNKNFLKSPYIFEENSALCELRSVVILYVGNTKLDFLVFWYIVQFLNNHSQVLNIFWLDFAQQKNLTLAWILGTNKKLFELKYFHRHSFIFLCRLCIEMLVFFLYFHPGWSCAKSNI